MDSYGVSILIFTAGVLTLIPVTVIALVALACLAGATVALVLTVMGGPIK